MSPQNTIVNVNKDVPLNLLWLKAQMSVDRIAEHTTLADLLEIKSRLEMRMHEEDSPDAEGETRSLA